MGPPASGKGTHADLLRVHFDLPSASPGAMLREEKQAGSALGLEADRLTSEGRLVSDEVINAVVRSWLNRQSGDGFVFDGYPRTLGQAAALDEMLFESGMLLEASLLLDADVATLRQRVEKRITCRACGNTTSLDLLPEGSGECPRCGGELSRRSDDTSETLNVRFREYLEKTAPVVGYYEKRHLLHRVKAAGSQNEVFAEVCRVLDLK